MDVGNLFVPDDDDEYTGPPLDDASIEAAEKSLGFKLPRSYLEVLAERNGGELARGCFPTPFKTSWADDHFRVRALLGIGGEWGIDATDGSGSADMIAEWGYPPIGVVIADMPSAGHDALMLDYSDCGPDGEPAVAYVDEDREPRRVADSFDAFLAGLQECDDDEEDLGEDAD